MRSANHRRSGARSAEMVFRSLSTTPPSDASAGYMGRPGSFSNPISTTYLKSVYESSGPGRSKGVHVHHPAPYVAHLDRLVEQVNRTGASVELDVTGTPRTLAPGLELCAYRVVQEALTNVVKHAGRARAQVTVGYGERDLTLEVTDDGPGPANGRPGGHGLAGMRRRVAVYAGQLETGPRPGGGFRVRARFPLERRQP